MIIDKLPLPDDPTPFDAPPSYDTLTSPTSSPSSGKPTEDTSLSSPAPPSASSSQGPRYSPTFLRPNQLKTKGKARSTWFSFSSRLSSTREVRSTVLGLIRDLVRQPHQRTSSQATIGILESCAEACTAYDLSFSSLLQEKSIEEHTPLYWAIIKRPPETPHHPEDQAEIPDFLTTLLSFSGPLSPDTISEIRLACLLTSDQVLFQRLRLSPEFSPLSGTDEILLGASMPPDEIVVSDVPGDGGAFVVNFGVVQFQQRMRVSKRIRLEFIARGRMWCLSFFVASHSQNCLTVTPGSWYISLSLLEHSPPTWIDSRLLIEQPPRPPSPESPLPTGGGGGGDDPTPSPRSPSFPNSMPKLKPTINFRFQSRYTQLTPETSTIWQGCSNGQNEILVSLNDSMMGSGLQYAYVPFYTLYFVPRVNEIVCCNSGCSYILPDGMLRARLEARLAKPEAECTIC